MPLIPYLENDADDVSVVMIEGQYVCDECKLVHIDLYTLIPAITVMQMNPEVPHEHVRHLSQLIV